MYHVTRAGIDLAAAADNYRYIRAIVDRTNKNTEIICVVKADAYGHGLRRICALYRDLGVTSYAVSNLDEAVKVREVVGEGPMILVLGYTDPAYAEVLCRYQITQTVFSARYAEALSGALREDLRVHLKIDTGMNRLGFPANDAGIADTVRCARLPHLICDGIFTHFATADEESPAGTTAQFESFLFVLDRLEREGITFRLRHVCNSAGTLRFPQMHLDAVRCGIILYGLCPSDAVRGPGLRPVMSLHSKIVHIHDLAPGDTVSYGGIFTATEPMRVATVPIGYDDGLLRSYAACGVFVGAQRATVLGRICMDQCIIDVTDIPCDVGDEVEIFGSHQSADDLARAAGTINYEVTCTVGKRVPRDEVSSD